MTASNKFTMVWSIWRLSPDKLSVFMSTLVNCQFARGVLLIFHGSFQQPYVKTYALSRKFGPIQLFYNDVLIYIYIIIYI